ncbi:MAG: hypothetical protein NTZ50_11940 [Chloroflexi bacterium]|nr:hypothetical protein [Chloroflexota bacterium]
MKGNRSELLQSLRAAGGRVHWFGALFWIVLLAASLARQLLQTPQPDEVVTEAVSEE